MSRKYSDYSIFANQWIQNYVKHIQKTIILYGIQKNREKGYLVHGLSNDYSVASIHDDYQFDRKVLIL